MSNRLAHEKSPYLLQHADNPVDWYPWGDEALSRARQENKPILVSIGYSACHWCHVMAHESFEDPTVAHLMNRGFINIKVDREERPDVDSIYMEAIQAISGHGGWPLNAFLTPDGRPFFGGTYYPPEPRHGLPSWSQVLIGVTEAYSDRHDEVTHNASQLTEYLQRAHSHFPAHGELSPEVLQSAYSTLLGQVDWKYGGFGGAPKFPQPLALEYLLRMYKRFGEEQARDFVLLTLRRMAAGGIHDQLGGGFHRYAVDDIWLVPHFEKMLYDNALLARVYLQAYQVTGEVEFERVVESTLDYLLRDVLAPEGAFFAAEDADSEGVEGKFYVWSLSEIVGALGTEQAETYALRFGVNDRGNLDGATILTLARTVEEVADVIGDDPTNVERSLGESQLQLLRIRNKRVRPGTDTKILAGWNALAIRALAEAGRVLGRPDYLAAAETAMEFVWTSMRPGARLVRSYREGPSSIPGFLEDHAYLMEALITLYETTYRPEYLQQAESLAVDMFELFWDEARKNFFDTRADEQLLVRPRNAYDSPIPAGSSAASFALLRLAALTDREEYRHRGAAGFQAVRDLMARSPQGFPYLLSALDFYFGPTLQIALVSEKGLPPEELLHAVFTGYLPNKVLAVGSGDYPALVAGRQQLDGQPTAYVCEHFSCRLPVTNAVDLAAQLTGTKR